jgi:hypothetical protein
MIKLTEQAVLDRGTLALAATLFISPWVFGFDGVPAAAWTAWIDAATIAMVSFAFSSTERRARLRTLSHACIDTFHKLAEYRIKTLTRVRKINFDLCGYAARVGREH